MIEARLLYYPSCFCNRVLDTASHHRLGSFITKEQTKAKVQFLRHVPGT